MFHIPMKLKPKLARPSMTTSDVNNQWRSSIYIYVKLVQVNFVFADSVHTLSKKTIQKICFLTEPTYADWKNRSKIDDRGDPDNDEGNNSDQEGKPVLPQQRTDRFSVIGTKGRRCKLSQSMEYYWHYRIMAVLKVETDIIASATARPTGRAVILMIMYVEIFKTGVIVFNL